MAENGRNGKNYKCHILHNGVVPLNADKPIVKAVTFDLWETLLFERDGANQRRTAARCKNLAQALGKFGIETSVDQLASALNETISSLLEVWDKDKDVTHLDQIRLILKCASKGSVTLKEEWVEELSSAYVSPILEVPPYLNPDGRKVLRWLRSRNKLIGLICNTGLTPGSGLRRFLSEEGVTKYFDVMIFSDEVGIRKPDPRIFHLAAEKLKIKPSEMVHVGDNLKTDVWGAKNAGFKAIYLSSDSGRDKIAESDPTSLVSLSRSLGSLKEDEIAPDAIITSLSMVTKVIKELEIQVF